MKKLEKFILENSESFNLEEPDDGHFERFERRHEKFIKSSAGFSWKYLLQAAAVTLLLVLSSLWVYENTFGTNEGSTLTLSDISSEYEDAEIYYTTLINKKYNEIRSFDFPENSHEQELVLQELAEMDTIYKSLEKELKAEKGNYMVINAMIMHYQLKLDIMSQILELLNEVQTTETIKNEDYENTTL